MLQANSTGGGRGAFRAVRMCIPGGVPPQVVCILGGVHPRWCFRPTAARCEENNAVRQTTWLLAIWAVQVLHVRSMLASSPPIALLCTLAACSAHLRLVLPQVWLRFSVARVASLDLQHNDFPPHPLILYGPLQLFSTLLIQVLNPVSQPLTSARTAHGL